jgi:diguanylate cyclase (GGDEF)-like protein
LVPLAQWSLMECAFRHLGAPGPSAFVPVIYIMAIEVMTGRVWCWAWLLAVAAGFPLGRWAAGRFDTRAGGTAAGLWANRYAAVVWCQAGLLSVGGFGATFDRNPITCVLVACPIAFALMQACATATLKRTVRLQALILVAPFAATCLLFGALLQGTMFYAITGGILCLWALGALQFADVAAGRIAALAMNMADSQHVQASRSGQRALPPAAEDFQRLLGRDQVTGLPNRHSFMRLLAEESDRAYLSEAPLSLLLVAWDEFDDFAARRSQHALDDMQARIARRLRTVLRRQPDRLASLGNGRFGVLLPATDAFGVTIVARNLQQAANTQEHDDASFAASAKVPLSIGAATYCGKGLLPEAQLLQFAEEALRNARSAGGDKIMRYDVAAKSVRPPPYLGPPAPESTPYSIPNHQIEAEISFTDSDPKDRAPEHQVITKNALGLELRH